MKKNLFIVLSLVSFVGLLSLTSCNKENTLGDGTQFRAMMEDCTPQNGKTTLNGTALEWVDGDQIAIYGTAGCGIYTATRQTPATTAVFDNESGETGNAPFRAFYPTTLTTDGVNVTLPAVQTYVEGSIIEFPMYAESSDNELSFKNLCGVLKLNLTKTGVDISSITVTAATEINGTFSVAYNSGDPELTNPTNGTNTTTLTCATPQSIATAHDFYIYLPAGSYTGLQITINTADGKTCTKTANTTINVIRSRYTTITLGRTDLMFRPVGSKGGLFSVSATQQVWFSQGNLQYQASTNIWRFAEHQWDYVGTQTDASGFYGGTIGGTVSGSDNRNIRSTYGGWIDLFGWGTSGWSSGAVCYQPWSTSTSYSDYYPGGSYTNGLTGAYVEADWAWHNAISNGGNAVHLWRTLTQSEWYYLLNTRTDASAKRGIGNINGVGGLIILPDSWTLPSGCSFTSGFASGWSLNSYTISQWAQMETAGAVFLPAAGYRYGTDVYRVDRNGCYGCYWMSTFYNDRFVYYVDFSFSYLSTLNSRNRCCGFNVRPVHYEE